MKVFVTGATGFIGKHLVKSLQKEGAQIIYSLREGEESPFDKTVKSYNFDEKNINTIIEFFKSEAIDGIIHLASLFLQGHRPVDIGQLIDSNVKFGTNVLECATKAEVKWFINTGTFWQNYQNVEYSPVNLYAATKQAFESIARYYIDTDQIFFCTLRLSDSYGLGDTRKKIFNIWEKIALSGEDLDMSPGEQIIDITYIDDIVNAFMLLVNYLQESRQIIKNGSVYAVKCEKRYTLKELASIFETVTGKKLNISWGRRPYREREVMVPWENGTVVPGWKAKVDLEEGIRKLFLFQ